MTATTPIYGLSYPEGSDLVSSAAGSFKAMADTFETALDTVDRRSTPAGATPVIATTLESLKAQTATVGQTGLRHLGRRQHRPVHLGRDQLASRTLVHRR